MFPLPYPRLFSNEGSLPPRMHALEASLFVIGYDVACLQPDRSAANDNARIQAMTAPLMEPKPDGGNFTVRPLSGRGQDIRYIGSIDHGFSIKRGDMDFALCRESIDEIINEFGGQARVPLGASQTPPRPAGSLGQWLVDNGWPSARYASAISPVLHKQGLISSHAGQKPILLDFV